MSVDPHRLPIKLNLRPGDNGTKRLMQKYGENLVCVRYRYDKENGKRYKTVELIEEISSVKPIDTHQREASKPAPTDRFGVKISYQETSLREAVKQMGAIWRPEHKLWEMTYAQIESLNLKERIAFDEESI